MNREQRAFQWLALATASLCLGAIVFHLLGFALVSNTYALLALVSGWQLWRKRPLQRPPAAQTNQRNES
ncbi:MAG: hypothetical protein ACOY3E_12640 [Pseudomonadota bacterium]